MVIRYGLKSSISEIESGKAPITERTIISICAQFNVNEEWLRTGKGDMFIIKDKKFEELYEVYTKLNPSLQDYILNTIKSLLDTQNKL